MAKNINIGLVGTQFMGRAHSNAYLDVNHYFDLPLNPVMKAVCDINENNLPPFMKQFGWSDSEVDYMKLIDREDIDLIDICTANDTHMPIAVAAAKAGKHVICEKPAAMNADEAKAMWEAAEEAGVRNMIAFNYRRVPAIQLAKRLIEEGKIGEIRHFNAVYYQDWLVDPAFPMVWRHDIKKGGSGAHGDMNAHTVDLARFLVGEINAVSGTSDVFIKERPFSNGEGTGKVTADDSLSFLARFENGAQGTFVATRFATGRKNFLRLEVFGSEGSFIFNLERLNELQYYARADDQAVQGFRNIVVTESTHPYIDAWWPPGHIIGWEHTFIHEVADFIMAVGKEKSVFPNFYDGYRCQLVLDAALKSADDQCWIKIEKG
jgi:predicted dehydrogenase